MVSLRRAIAAAGLLLPALPVCAAPLDVQLATPRVEYGKPVQVVLRGPVGASLSDINLDGLAPDFYIQEKILLDPEASTGRAGLKLRLYPRREGTLTVPALSWRGNFSHATTVAVTSAVDPKNHKPIAVSVAHTEKPVWLKQPYTVTVTMQTRDAIVNLHRAGLEQAGFSVYELPEEVDTAQAGVTTRRFGWVIYPLTSGVHTLNLPPVEYIRDGVVTHRFHLPRIRPEVMPLPSYVPVTMPVGRVDVEVERPGGVWVTRNRRDHFVVRVRGDALPGQDMQPLLREMKDTARFGVYPARATRAETASAGAIRSDIDFRVPFVARGSGWITLPTLRWHYFDPHTGKIRSQALALGYVISVPRWLSVSVLALLSVVVVFAGRWGWRKVQRYGQRIRHYRAAMHSLRAARSAPELRAALGEIARAEGWPANLSVRQWYELWATRFPRRTAPAAPLQSLQRGLYRGAVVPLDDVRSALIALCRWRSPFPSCFGK